QPNLEIAVELAAQRAIDRALHDPPIVGMHTPKDQIDVRLDRWIESEDAQTLGRPEWFAAGDIEADRARVAQPLRLRQQRFAAAKRLLGALAILDVGCCRVASDDVSASVAQPDDADQKPSVFAVGA